MPTINYEPMPGGGPWDEARAVAVAALCLLGAWTFVASLLRMIPRG
jgi:hypothetical protein